MEAARWSRRRKKRKSAQRDYSSWWSRAAYSCSREHIEICLTWRFFEVRQIYDLIKLLRPLSPLGSKFLSFESFANKSYRRSVPSFDYHIVSALRAWGISSVFRDPKYSDSLDSTTLEHPLQFSPPQSPSIHSILLCYSAMHSHLSTTLLEMAAQSRPLSFLLGGRLPLDNETHINFPLRWNRWLGLVWLWESPRTRTDIPCRCKANWSLSFFSSVVWSGGKHARAQQPQQRLTPTSNSSQGNCPKTLIATWDEK